jgi:hypothetical protein
MLVHKYYCRPADPASEAAALDEIARYVQARNRLTRLREKWQRIREEMILPEYRARAAELRVTPRTGRKPSKERTDHAELRAADSRREYAEFIAAGGSYATWWLAEAAAKKAKHPLRDETSGRAGMLPQWLRWEESVLHYAGTQWSVHAKQLARRPVPEQARVAQAWLQRERTSTNLLRTPRHAWFLILVLDDVSPRMRDVSGVQRTAAGLDIAWRQDADTLRVAYVADGGGHEAIRLPAVQYARLQHAASLQQLGDQEANHLRAVYGVPPNTSHRRLIELALPPGPLPPYDHQALPQTPSDHAQHLVHLMEWHHGERRNAHVERDQYYLSEAHRLCGAHHTIFVEQIKGTPRLVQKAGTRRKKGALEDAQGGVARDQRQMVAPFTFLRTLQREAPKFRTEIVEVPAAYTSRICVACEYDMGKSGAIERSCAGCGQRWDIDHLAALNLLRWGGSRKTTETAAE